MKNKIRVLELIPSFLKKTIRIDLALTHRGINSIYKELKNEGLIHTIGFGGSGCTCIISENQNYCECDGNPYVGRRTELTEKGKEFLKNSK